ncbi:MAG: M48 family metalloprotease [Lysobacterales bacterium]
MNRIFVNILVSVLAVICLASCAVNPVSGERELALMPESQEIEIGRQTALSAESQLGLVDDPQLQDYVQRLGAQLAAASERPELPWTFRVLDESAPNAFAAPGGYIFVTRGLLALMNNEAELVSVIGHEIGHVTARHSVSQMSRQQLAQIGLGIGSILSPQVAKFGDLAAGGLQMLFLSYGREDERQADDLGYRYALDQNYDVREMVNVFAALQQSATLAGQSPVPTWMASHPYPAERIARIEEQLETLPPSESRRIGEADYLARIDGLVYGENPRNGYFESNHFYHPDLAFHLEMPAGWQTQNLSHMVVAGSPDKDALIQLSIVPDARQEAANKFFAQEGLTAGRVSAERINGLDALVGRFEVQTEQGQLGGMAAFVTLADNTYRILAYTPAQKLAGYERAFNGSIGSFSRLTDRAALARQPNRLAITRLPRAMTLTQFNQNYPSTIPLDELALINHLSGPDSTMPSNYPAKRVVDYR